MPRIRTLKPEFPQSESMGRVSRDARLLFIELWTLCDDSGRTRAVSRMLASLLFPYDDDAPKLIDGWMDELVREGCIAFYEVGGAKYMQVCNWLKHQKIDKPSKSNIPEFDESSRILANPRELSLLDQGPRTKDQGKEKEKPAPKASAQTEHFPVIPDWVSSEAWDGFVEMRKKLRFPLTARAAKLVIKALEKLRDEGHNPATVLDQSTRNSWRDVFPVKADLSKGSVVIPSATKPRKMLGEGSSTNYGDRP